MISIWDIGPFHLGRYKDVTDGVNVWSGEVLDYSDKVGYALKEGKIITYHSREVFVGEQRHFAYEDDVVVEEDWYED